jgi:hypothetical protein
MRLYQEISQQGNIVELLQRDLVSVTHAQLSGGLYRLLFLLRGFI